MIGIIAALAVAFGSPQGQRPKAVSQAINEPVVGDELTVYLLTFDPGGMVWERFGHNAVWIRDNKAGSDWAYDYGRFSFGSTIGDVLRFAGRFAAADMRYSMGEGDARAYLAAYQRAGRSIWAQELDLPPAARAALRDFLVWNAKEENKYYQYHYYLDNCSTRIRDALDRVVGGQLKTWAQSTKTVSTYRDHTRRTTENSVTTYTLLMFGLGQPVDQPVSAWEEMFLPISLRPYLNQLSVVDPDGRRHPLVKEERHLVESQLFSVRDRPSNWTVRYLAVGVLLGSVLLGLGRVGRRSLRGRWGFGVAAVSWTVVSGLGGVVLAALWAFSAHRFSYWNENVLQLNLGALALALVLPRAVWRGQIRYQQGVRLAGAVAVISALGLGLKILPQMGQANLDMIALVLPVHLGVWLGLGALGAGPSS